MAKSVKEVTEKLKRAISADDEEAIVEAIEGLEKSRAKISIPALLDLMEKDARIGVTSAAALALSALGSNEAVPLLVKLLRDRKNVRQNGTFLYALQSLKWWKNFATEVAMFVADPSFEVRIAALSAIQQAKEDLSEHERAGVMIGLAFGLIKAPTSSDIRESVLEALQVMAPDELASVGQELIEA